MKDGYMLLVKFSRHLKKPCLSPLYEPRKINASSVAKVAQDPGGPHYLYSEEVSADTSHNNGNSTRGSENY